MIHRFRVLWTTKKSAKAEFSTMSDTVEQAVKHGGFLQAHGIEGLQSMWVEEVINGAARGTRVQDIALLARYAQEVIVPIEQHEYPNGGVF